MLGKPLRLLLDTVYPTNIAEGSESVEYLIRIPPPHINVLLARHDRATAKVKGSDDPAGHIVDRVSDPPGPGNAMGSRDWSWSTKGYSRWNRSTKQYGIAISLAIPLDNYFNDKPYLKGTVWDETLGTSGGWRAPTSADLKLEPLSRTEDPEDSGHFLWDPIAEQYRYDGYAYGAPRNGQWDGDRRLLDKNEWYVDANAGNDKLQLSPLDIDNNGYIELPPAIDPYADNSSNQYATYDPVQGWINPYTKAWVLMHTITHEIVHALGGYEHSPFPNCLMHEYSYDYRRQDYISDWYRAKLIVHNKLRELPQEVFNE